MNETELLRACMHSHDIKEVCKLRLSNTMEDTIAWHYAPVCLAYAVHTD
jgi:hypothetical protein